MFDVFDISSDVYFLLGNGAGVLILIAFVLAGARRLRARPETHDVIAAADRLSVDGG